MRSLLRAALVAGLMAGPFSGSVRAVSIEDLLNLKANGLGDEILVALIETDGSVFRLSAADVLALRERGLGEKVILAMIASGRRAAPRVVRVRETVVRTVVLPAPAAPRALRGPVAPRPRSNRILLVRAPEPTYWGFGGRLRPDAWQPTPERRRTAGSAHPAAKRH